MFFDDWGNILVVWGRCWEYTAILLPCQADWLAEGVPNFCHPSDWKQDSCQSWNDCSCPRTSSTTDCWIGTTPLKLEAELQADGQSGSRVAKKGHRTFEFSDKTKRVPERVWRKQEIKVEDPQAAESIAKENEGILNEIEKNAKDAAKEAQEAKHET